MAIIKIIDDDTEFMENLSLILRKEGYEVSTRDSIEGAEEELAEEMPDLLILDVIFPENPAAGFDLARNIRERKDLKKLPVILLTAVNQELPMDFSSKDIDPEWMPVEDFVEKPVNFEELLGKIKIFYHREAVDYSLITVSS
ncbi:MAG: response regulator [Spirochaetes bacterium]|nr:MAG: response regulator [Spirochaetota bacterium]